MTLEYFTSSIYLFFCLLSQSCLQAFSLLLNLDIKTMRMQKYVLFFLCCIKSFHFNCIKLLIEWFKRYSTFLVQSTQAQALLAEEDAVQSDEVDSDRFSGSNSSFLANEKLVSLDSMNSDITGILFPPL